MANAMQNRRSSIALALGRASITLILAAILAFGAITRSQPAQAQSFLSLVQLRRGRHRRFALCTARARLAR